MGLCAVSAVFIVVAGCGRFGFDPRSIDDARVDARPGVVPVSNPAVVWTTPHGVLVSWDFSNDAMLDHFEIITGPTETSVITRDSTSLSLGPADRPELAFALLPFSGDRARHTVVDGLVPDTDIWIRVIAVDHDGGESATTALQSRTALAPSNAILLFDESLGSAYTLPPELALSSDRPYAGATDLEYVQACITDPDCYENLRVQNGAQDLGVVALGSAYFEAWFANAAATPSYWSQFRLRFGCGPPCDFSFQPLTYSGDGNYHRLEIPLAALASINGPITASDLTSVVEWGIGGRWELDAVVRIDEVRIRW